MRTIAALLVCAILTGCATYTGIHGESKPVALKKPSPKFSVTAKWWTIFRDDQLDSLIEEAIENSPTIRIAQARIRQAKSMADVSGADLYPQLDANGSAVRERISAKGYFPPPLGGSTLNLGQLTLDFDYEFDWWGRNRAALDAALNETSVTEAEAVETRLLLGLAVAQTYFALQADLAKLNTSKQILARQEALLDLARFRAKSGIDSDDRASQMAGLLAQEKIGISKLDEAVKLGRSQISALLGKPQNAEKPIAARIDPPPPLPSSIPADSIGQRPDVMAQQYRLAAASNRIDQAKAEFFPNIDLSAYAGVQSIGFGNLFKGGSDIASFGPAIHLPIFGGGRLRANLGEKYAEYDIAVEEYNRMVIGAMRDVAQASTSLKSVSSQIAAQNDVLRALGDAHRIALDRYNHGLGDALSVLEAETPLLIQKNVKTDLDERRLELTLEMIQSLGGAPSINPG